MTTITEFLDDNDKWPNSPTKPRKLGPKHLKQLKRQEAALPDIKKAYEGGVPIHEIAAIYHFSHRTIHKLANKHKFVRKAPTHPERRYDLLDYKEEIEALLKDPTYRIQDIARRFKVSEPTLSRYMNTLGITTGRGKRQKSDKNIEKAIAVVKKYRPEILK